MSTIYRNKNPAGKLWNLAFGLAELADGVLRLVTLGYYCSRLCVDVSRLQTEHAIRKLKAKRDYK